MDFTLSLTHFCESHGPKSVLCTQVLPLECNLCLPPSPSLHPQPSADSLRTHNDDFTRDGQPHTRAVPSLKKTDTNNILPTGFSRASTTVDSEPESPSIERHPLFKNHELGANISPHFRYGRAQGETCASCSFSAPELVADRLPSGAPGSVKADGKNKNGAPVFRSREFVCLGTSPPSISSSQHHSSTTNESTNTTSTSQTSTTFGSYPSTYSPPDSCHDHTLTYLTAKAPEDPSTYSVLRASVIRTLSCELLPRGMSDGPLCFGDSTTGYTIAYVFRLTDPKARGRRRCYAFLALAGNDASRAFRACPMLWESFANMAKGIEVAAQRCLEEKLKQQEAEEEIRAGRNEKKGNYTPVSSFLNQRALDPDGTMRRAGQTVPRSLADIVGDETIFAVLHQYFTALLHCLGDRFGGIPLAGQIQTMADSQGLSAERVPRRVHKENVTNSSAKLPQVRKEKNGNREAMDQLRDDDATTRPGGFSKSSKSKSDPTKTTASREKKHEASKSIDDDVDKTMKRLSKINLGGHQPPQSQCAPLRVTEAARGEVTTAGSRQVFV